jgi:hypothetical protein
MGLCLIIFRLIFSLLTTPIFHACAIDSPYDPNASGLLFNNIRGPSKYYNPNPFPHSPTLLCQSYLDIPHCTPHCYCNSTMHVSCSFPSPPSKNPAFITNFPPSPPENAIVDEDHCAHTCLCGLGGERHWYGKPLEMWTAKGWNAWLGDEYRRAKDFTDGHPRGFFEWVEKRTRAEERMRGENGGLSEEQRTRAEERMRGEDGGLSEEQRTRAERRMRGEDDGLIGRWGKGWGERKEEKWREGEEWEVVSRPADE